MAPALRDPRILAALLALAQLGCGGGGGGGFIPTLPLPTVAFDPVGAPLGSVQAIAFAFLPGTAADALVATKDGRVLYTQGTFATVLASTTVAVASTGEQGLQNLVVDPGYATNRFVFLYFTVPGGASNRVLRATVQVLLAPPGLTLADPVTIADFPKSESPSPGTNHNGGGMGFDGAGNLYVAVGDGGGPASADPGPAIGQDLTVRLGKLHRIIPSRVAGVGGFTTPANGVSGTHPSIFAYGLRNPFTLAVAPDGAALLGDVGANFFEELDRADAPGSNFGWPLAEGPVGSPSFVDPIHGYLHTDTLFETEDPDPAPGGGPQSVMAGALYTGGQYAGRLDGLFLYSDFYEGWVRGLRLSATGSFGTDQHLGHLEGMTCLRPGPDGLLYAVSLFQSDRILRLRLE